MGYIFQPQKLRRKWISTTREAAMFDQIKQIFVDTIHVDETLITLDAKLKEDLDIDSLTKLELVLEFENAFEIRIEDIELVNIKTVGDIVDTIKKKLNS
jgi:acyl carrier protein